MKKLIVKRLFALLLSCSIVIGAVAASEQKAYAMGAAGAIAGTGAVVGSETAFAYLLGIMGFTAASAAVYENRDAIVSWGKTQLNKFKSWAKEKKDELTAWAGSTATDIETTIDAWGSKLSSGTLDKTDGTWSAVKKWVQDDVYSPASDIVPTYKGWPWVGKNKSVGIGELTYSLSFLDGQEHDYGIYTYYGGGWYYAVWVTETLGFNAVVNKNGKVVSSSEVSERYNKKNCEKVINGKTFYMSITGRRPDTVTWTNYLGDLYGYGQDAVFALAADVYLNGVDAIGGDDNRDYVYTGGLAGVLDGAGVIDNTDVVGTGSKEDEEKSTTLPWPANNSLDQVLGGVSAGEKTWSDVLDTVGAGVIDRTDAGDMVIDDDGVTEKEWAYSPAIPTTPDITIPDTAEASKELKDYTITGLESFFPFCLPFDAIAFLKVLDAPPEAPHFTIPFKYPTKDGLATYEIEIDLSPFDTAATILRSMECLLFIVGLIMTTRSRMIRG